MSKSRGENRKAHAEGIKIELHPGHRVVVNHIVSELFSGSPGKGIGKQDARTLTAFEGAVPLWGEDMETIPRGEHANTLLKEYFVPSTVLQSVDDWIEKMWKDELVNPAYAYWVLDLQDQIRVALEKKETRQE